MVMKEATGLENQIRSHKLFVLDFETVKYIRYEHMPNCNTRYSSGTHKGLLKSVDKLKPLQFAEELEPLKMKIRGVRRL